MKIFIFITFLILAHKSNAQHFYEFSNNFFDIKISIKNTDIDSNIIVIQFDAIQDVLFLDNRCFFIDSKVLYFRNTWCEKYILGDLIEDSYILIKKNESFTMQITDVYYNFNILQLDLVIIPFNDVLQKNQKKYIRKFYSYEGNERYNVDFDVSKNFVHNIKCRIEKW